MINVGYFLFLFFYFCITLFFFHCLLWQSGISLNHFLLLLQFLCSCFSCLSSRRLFLLLPFIRPLLQICLLLFNNNFLVVFILLFIVCLFIFLITLHFLFFVLHLLSLCYTSLLLSHSHSRYSRGLLDLLSSTVPFLGAVCPDVSSHDTFPRRRLSLVDYVSRAYVNLLWEKGCASLHSRLALSATHSSSRG